MTGWTKHKLDLRLVGETSITSDMQMIIHMHPYGRKWRRTKEHPDESEREEWKSWLKTQHSKNEDHGIRFHHFMANRWRNNVNSDRLYLLRLQNHCQKWLQLWNGKTLTPWKKSYYLDSLLKSRDYFANKGPCSQSYGFPSSYVQVWDLDHKEGQKL